MRVRAQPPQQAPRHPPQTHLGTFLFVEYPIRTIRFFDELFQRFFFGI